MRKSRFGITRGHCENAFPETPLNKTSPRTKCCEHGQPLMTKRGTHALMNISPFLCKGKAHNRSSPACNETVFFSLPRSDAFVGLGSRTIQDACLCILTLRTCVFYILTGMVLQLAARRLPALTASVVHAAQRVLFRVAPLTTPFHHGSVGRCVSYLRDTARHI